LSHSQQNARFQTTKDAHVGVFQFPENGDSLLQRRKAQVWHVVDEVYEQFGRV
jgi:hypothetical protein